MKMCILKTALVLLKCYKMEQLIIRLLENIRHLLVNAHKSLVTYRHAIKMASEEMIPIRHNNHIIYRGSSIIHKAFSLGEKL